VAKFSWADADVTRVKNRRMPAAKEYVLFRREGKETKMAVYS
jgi:hypothetical protein